MEILKIPKTLPHWELFAHASDIGLRAFGTSLKEAFSEAGVALTAMVTDPELVEPKEAHTVACSAPDQEILLMDWLNAIIYEMAIHQMLFKRFDIKLKDLSIEAKIWGEPVDIAKHSPAVEPKAATFAELKVTQLKEGPWMVQCVVDV